MLKLMNDIRFVFFTNEKNIDFFTLTLKYFLKHVQDGEKISVILNNLTRNDLPYNDKVEYVNANIDFDDQGRHFGRSIAKVAGDFKEKYIFLFLDDYFLISNVNYTHLKSVLNLMDRYNIDCFSFEHRHAEESLHSKPFDVEDEYLKGKLFIKTNENRYLYSLQPSIWKKESLVELCQNNDFTLHEMDETRSDLKIKNKFKCLNNDLLSFFNQIDIENKEHFVIAYCELIRNGVFPTPENGFYHSEEEPFIKLIRKIVKDEDLVNRKEFSRKIGNIK